MNPNTHQAFSAFAIPFVLILVSGFTRKIIRGKSPFRPSDFYLGLDLTLAAFSSAAVNILEINPTGRGNLAWYFVFTFIIFMLQLAIHQEWGGPPASSRKQIILLGFLSNGIGIALLGFFIHSKIGGKL